MDKKSNTNCISYGGEHGKMKTVNVLGAGRAELWMVFKKSVTSINNFIKMASCV